MGQEYYASKMLSHSPRKQLDSPMQTLSALVDTEDLSRKSQSVSTCNLISALQLCRFLLDKYYLKAIQKGCGCDSEIDLSMHKAPGSSHITEEKSKNRFQVGFLET